MSPTMLAVVLALVPAVPVGMAVARASEKPLLGLAAGLAVGFGTFCIGWLFLMFKFGQSFAH